MMPVIHANVMTCEFWMLILGKFVHNSSSGNFCGWGVMLCGL
uniref:Uncharacterized protein n=1 Tax=Setaria italica TaxID=4555 RepID=K3Y3Z0_SETIT